MAARRARPTADESRLAQQTKASMLGVMPRVATLLPLAAAFAQGAPAAGGAPLSSRLRATYSLAPSAGWSAQQPTHSSAESEREKEWTARTRTENEKCREGTDLRSPAARFWMRAHPYM